jgi:vacuolar-type H+-ATPase subunit E/Vma4
VGQVYIKKIDSQAEARENQILVEAEEEARKIHETNMRSVDEQIRMEKSRIISKANFQLKKEVIRIKENMMNQVFNETIKGLENLRNQSSYESVFEKLAAETVKGISGKAEIFIDQADEQLARKVFDKMDIDYTIKSNIKCLGGLKAMSENGKIVFNNTIDSRIEKAKQFLMTDVIKVLFGDS